MPQRIKIKNPKCLKNHGGDNTDFKAFQYKLFIVATSSSVFQFQVAKKKKH